MAQVARPNTDVSDSGWTPTPLFSRINGTTPDNYPFITSAGSTGGDTFQVGLSGLAWPETGMNQLAIRMWRTSEDNLPVTVTLLQGTTVIATRVLNPQKGPPPTEQSSTEIPLSESEIAKITNYNNLRVQVSTVPPTISRRPLGTQGNGASGSTLTLPSVKVFAGEMLIVSVGATDVAVSSITFNGVALQAAVTAANTGNCRSGIYYLAVGSDTTGDIIVTWSAAAAGRNLLATAVAALTNNVVDQTASNTGSGTAPSSGSVTTTAANEYVHGVIFLESTPHENFATWLNGFILGQQNGVELQGQLVVLLIQEGYIITSATGSFTAAGTIPVSALWVALLATFK